MYGLKIWNGEGVLYFSSELDFACVFATETVNVNTLISSATPSGYAKTVNVPRLQIGGVLTREVPATLVNIPVGCILMECFAQSISYSPSSPFESVLEVATKTSSTINVIHYAPFKEIAPFLDDEDYGPIVKNGNDEIKWNPSVKLLNLIGTVGLANIPLTVLSFYTYEFVIDYNLDDGEDFFFDIGDSVGQYYLPETYGGGVILHRISSHVFRFYTTVKFDVQAALSDAYGNIYTIYNSGITGTGSGRQVGNGTMTLDHSRRGSSMNMAVFAHKL